MRPSHRILAAAVLAVCVAGSTNAATRTWDGGGGSGQSFWDLNTNWSSDTTPGSADTAVFSLAGTTVVHWDNITGNTSTAALQILGGDVTFQSNASTGAPFTHTVTGDTQVNNAGAAFRLNNFILTTQGFFDLNGGGVLEASTGSTINAFNMSIGFTGVGNALTVHNGAKVNVSQTPLIGELNGSNGTLVVQDANSVFSAGKNFIIGSGTTGKGTVTINAGGRINVGNAVSSTGYGLLLSDTNVAGGVGGEMSVSNGSTLTNNSGFAAEIGDFNSYGRARVSGANSTWTNSTTLSVGFGAASKGFLDVSAGGTVSADSFLNLGSFGGTATATVDGASLLWGKSDLNMGNTLFGGAGNITLTNGGDLRVGDRSDNAPNYDVYVSDADPIGTAGGVLSILNGSHLASSQNASIGTFTGQSGRVVISGTNSRWTGATEIDVGYQSIGDMRVDSQGACNVAGNVFVGAFSGSNGTLAVAGGGTLTTSFQLVIGSIGQTSTGAVTVTGANSTIAVGTRLEVGRDGNGTLTINSGGNVTDVDASVAGNSGSVGNVTLSDAGSIWTTTHNLSLGSAPGGPNGSGVGHLTLNGGGHFYVGDTAAAAAEADYNIIDDSSANASDGGVLFVYNGSTVTNNTPDGFEVGRAAGHSGRIIVSGTGSSITTTSGGFSFIGIDGQGFLNISAGGSYVTAADIGVGYHPTGTGTVTIDGANSMLWAKGNATIGSQGVGTVTTTNGGSILVGDDAVTSAGFDLLVSDGDPIGTAGGVLTVGNGSTLTTNQQGIIGSFGGQAGRVIVSDTGSNWSAGNNVLVGNPADTASHGELIVNGGGRVVTSTNLVLDGTGSSVTVSSAGRVETTFQVLVSQNAGSTTTATVTGADSTIAVGTTLEVGRSGTGTLNINAGGKVTDVEAVVGTSTGGVGTVTMTDAGSTWTTTHNLSLGQASGSGVGHVTVSSGSRINVGDLATAQSFADYSFVGDSSVDTTDGGTLALYNGSTLQFNTNGISIAEGVGQYGRIIVSGSGSSASMFAMTVGGHGSAKLDVAAGGAVNLEVMYIGNNPTAVGTVTVDGAGSKLTAATELRLGGQLDFGVGSLTTTAGGSVYVGDAAALSASNNSLIINDVNASGTSGGLLSVTHGSTLTHNGTTSVGPGTNGGQYGRMLVTSNAGTSTFTANGAVTVGPKGILDVQLGALVNVTTGGVTLQNGGHINLTGGELRSTSLDISASPAGFSFNGGQLSATSVNGSLTQSGGTLAPNGSGSARNPLVTITGNYTITAGSVQIEQSATADDGIDVTGQLSLAGNLSLVNIGYTPTLGDHFGIMRGATRVGQFATVSGLSLSANRSLAVTYETDPFTSKPAVFYTVAIPGDATLSNGVEFNDLVILAQNYNFTGRTWSTADFTGDGATNFDDLVILAQHYGVSALGTLPASVSPDFAGDWALAQSMVPEPAAMTVLPLLAAVRRRRRAVRDFR